MIFFASGLHSGERLALCSDEARLPFPYIAGLVNGLGRLQLSIPLILERAYQTFRTKPTKEQVISWISEYRRNFLLFVYVSADGEVWGQLCGIPDNALPRYQTAADRKSPAPVSEEITAFDAEYCASKRRRMEASEDFVNLSEHFGNLPKGSEQFSALQNISAGEDVDVDVVVDEDVDEEEIHTPPPAAAHERFREAWNAECGTLARVAKLTKSRVAKLKSRIGEGLTLESFGTAVRLCASTPFLRGAGRDGWRADFDFLICNDTNLTKVLEGKYANGTPAAEPKRTYRTEDFSGE